MQVWKAQHLPLPMNDSDDEEHLIVLQSEKDIPAGMDVSMFRLETHTSSEEVREWHEKVRRSYLG
jgi:hypothetical protein